MRVSHPHPPRWRAVTRPAVVLGLILSLAGCGTHVGDGVGGDGTGLEGKTFVSTGVAGRELAPGSEVRMIFQADRVTVRAGCNTLSGAATWDDGALHVEQPMARTMMACADDLEREDAWLEAFLLSEPGLRLDGDVLVLGDGDEGLTLVEQ